jgi:cytochrome c-type biogenesis protein CcmH
MPLAILRKQVKDLPIQFTLDDSMAMSPATRLSLAGKVIVGARISKTANAVPAVGDLSGQSAVVAVGTKGLMIEIKDVLKQ